MPTPPPVMKAAIPAEHLSLVQTFDDLLDRCGKLAKTPVSRLQREVSHQLLSRFIVNEKKSGRRQKEVGSIGRQTTRNERNF